MYNFARKKAWFQQTELNCTVGTNTCTCILFSERNSSTVTTYQNERYSDIKFLEVCFTEEALWYRQ